MPLNLSSVVPQNSENIVEYEMKTKFVTNLASIREIFNMSNNTIPIATLDFNIEDLEKDEVGRICNKIRELDDFVVFEQGHNETYTVARKED